MQIIIITVNVVFSVVFLPTVFVMQVLSNLGYVLKSMKNAIDWAWKYSTCTWRVTGNVLHDKWFWILSMLLPQTVFLVSCTCSKDINSTCLLWYGQMLVHQLWGAIAGLGEYLNSSLPFGQPTLTFCLSPLSQVFKLVILKRKWYTYMFQVIIQLRTR